VAAASFTDGLYGLPAEEFTSQRNAAARELKKAGLRAEAARVEDQRRPTAAAAAVNRLVRARRKDVERFLEAAEALRDSQVGGAAGIQAATRKEREALTRLVKAGGAQVRQSLQAAAVDRLAAEQLLAGRLVRELEPAGFGTLAEHTRRASRPAATPVAAPKPRPKRDDSAARARLGRAKQAHLAAQKELSRAERSLKRAREQLAETAAAVEKAQAALERARNE
jgi:hypothetical protein